MTHDDTLSRMPFGKHKGQRFTDLPESYLDWLLSLDDLSPALAGAIRREARRRHTPEEVRTLKEQIDTLNATIQRLRADLKRTEQELATLRRPRPDRIPDALRPVVTQIVTRGFRSLAQDTHPDRGGTHAAMVTLNQAYDTLRALTSR